MTIPNPKLCPMCGARYDAAAVFCQRDGARLSQEGAPDPFLGRDILGQFRIDAAIGAGGMGTVYRAHQTTLDRDVAVKILHPELTTNPDAVRRFHREARVATSLEHPGLVRVFLFGELPGDGNLYLVMEHLDGTSLASLTERGALEVPRALHLATQICDAVGVAHASGIVHRDIKPENVMIVERHGDPDFVKVLDFGIARLLWDDQSAMTQSGVIFGTARYISPEGAAGEPTDARSDVYGIGVLVYQLLTGVTPFEAPTAVAMLMKHIHETAPDLRRMGAGARVPPAVAEVVMRAVAKHPSARFANAADFGVALRAAAERSAIILGAARASWAPGRAPAPAPAPPAPGSSSAPAPAYVAETPLVHPGGPSNTTDIRVPGLRRSPFGSLALAFALGVGAVVGGVYAYQAYADAQVQRAAEGLATRAREALEARRYDAPPGKSVADLIVRLQEVDGEGELAAALRREAANQLRDEAQRAESEGREEDARLAYQRLLHFQPADPAATASVERLRLALAAPPREAPGLRLSPSDEARAGEAVSLLAVLQDGASAGEEPTFDVFRGRRRLSRVPAVAGEEGRYLGSYVFRRAGRYEVRFEGEGDTRFEAALRVRGRAVASEEATTTSQQRTASTAPPSTAPPSTGPPSTAPPSTAPPSIRPRAVPAQSDGIDWSIPASPTPRGAVVDSEADGARALQPIPPQASDPQPRERERRELEPSEPAPPAPWTGSGVI